jgi:hypothetical protein
MWQLGTQYVDAPPEYAYVGNNPARWADPLGEERLLADEIPQAPQDPGADLTSLQHARETQRRVLEKLCKCCAARSLVEKLNSMPVRFCRAVYLNWNDTSVIPPQRRQRIISGYPDRETGEIVVNINADLDEILATIVHEHEHFTPENLMSNEREVGAFIAETKMALACGWRTKHMEEFTTRVFVPLRRRCRFAWCTRGYWATIIDEEAIRQHVRSRELYRVTGSAPTWFTTEPETCPKMQDWKC